jgi:hypothetical protein
MYNRKLNLELTGSETPRFSASRIGSRIYRRTGWQEIEAFHILSFSGNSAAKIDIVFQVG